MIDVLTIGDTTLDTFLILDEDETNIRLDKERRWLSLHYGEKMYIKDTAQSMGGNAANVAAGVKKLGLNVALVTELGDDLNGHTVLAELERQHIDTKWVKVHRNKETRYSVVLNYKGERTILSYFSPRSYTLPNLPDSNWIYYTSLGASFEQLQHKLEQHLVRHPETKLALNPGSFQLKDGLSHIRTILPRTSLLFVNKEEAETITGKRKRTTKLLTLLQAMGPETVVITDSVRGSFVRHQHHSFSMTPYPVPVVAKTGAGDAYASGFLSAFIKQKTIPVAMQWGTANAAGVISAYGAQRGLLTSRSIQKMINTYPSITPKKLL